MSDFGVRGGVRALIQGALDGDVRARVEAFDALSVDERVVTAMTLAHLVVDLAREHGCTDDELRAKTDGLADTLTAHDLDRAAAARERRS